MKLKLLFFSLFLLCCHLLTAQVKPVNKDSIKVYKDLENYSKKNKFNKLVHKLLFKSTRKSTPSKKNQKKRFLLNRAFEKNECKIIRNINNETLDPFGYSIDNKSDKPNNTVERFGNKVHLKTKNFVIKNLLLIKKNQPLDSLLAKESERLIRGQRYVRSVLIEPIPIKNNKDSVDISVRVLDSWSLIPTGSLSETTGNLEITERNVFGLGHEFEQSITNKFVDKKNGNSSRYTINNIANSFTNFTLFYENDQNSYTRKSAKLERIFYSPLTHWAGGIYFENRFYKDSLPNINETFQIQRFKFETQDYWVGHSFKIFPGISEDFRTTNFVSTLRYQNINYLEKPDLEYDATRFFNDKKTYLASIGITTRKFAEDKYLFNFGVIEDVPFGQVYSITAGFEEKNENKRFYFGSRFAYGNYYSFGYLGTNIEWGSFYNNGYTEETTFRIEGNYFTNIIQWGNWKIRQFIKPTFVFGNHRDPSIKDRININDSNGLSGFSSSTLFGTKKWVASFQTQTYSPGNWHGFHFNPYLNISLGMIGNEQDAIFNKKLYSSFGIGVLISNDYLVFNSFQLSLAFYPSIPNEGANIFKTNSFKNNDLSLPDYQIGKPIVVPYN